MEDAEKMQDVEQPLDNEKHIGDEGPPQRDPGSPDSNATPPEWMPRPAESAETVRKKEILKLLDNSRPPKQFFNQARRECTRLLEEEAISPSSCLSDFGRYRERQARLARVDFQALADNLIRNRWVRQGIWLDEWGPAWATGYQRKNAWLGPGDGPFDGNPNWTGGRPVLEEVLWGHESASEVQEALGICDVLMMPWKPAPMGGDDRASKPYSQFLYQICCEREWLRYKHQDEFGFDQAEDFLAKAYDAVKENWMSDGIWRKDWVDVPTGSWLYEDPEEDEYDTWVPWRFRGPDRGGEPERVSGIKTGAGGGVIPLFHGNQHRHDNVPLLPEEPPPAEMDENTPFLDVIRAELKSMTGEQMGSEAWYLSSSPTLMLDPYAPGEGPWDGGLSLLLRKYRRPYAEPEIPPRGILKVAGGTPDSKSPRPQKRVTFCNGVAPPHDTEASDFDTIFRKSGRGVANPRRRQGRRQFRGNSPPPQHSDISDPADKRTSPATTTKRPRVAEDSTPLTRPRRSTRRRMMREPRADAAGRSSTEESD